MKCYGMIMKCGPEIFAKYNSYYTVSFYTVFIIFGAQKYKCAPSLTHLQWSKVGRGDKNMTTS